MSLTANRVWPIMERRVGWGRVRAFCWSTVGSSGNSSGSLPRILNSDRPHLMLTI